jgi:DNA-binding transcriptional MerR regulator
MPNENEYSLSDLASLTGVSARTIRYYIAMGLLPSPTQAGPGARYSEGHLARLRLIKQLQREHFPLADIRSALAELSDDQVVEMLEAPTGPQPPTSAKDYISGVLGETPAAQWRTFESRLSASRPFDRLSWRLASLSDVTSFSVEPARDRTPAEPPTPDRSQWDRVALTNDIELHVRRPLSRHQHRQVEKLIAIARQVLEEE